MTPQDASIEAMRLLKESFTLVSDALIAESEVRQQQAKRLELLAHATEAIALDARQARTNVHLIKDLMTATVAQQALIVRAVSGEKPTSGEWQAAQQEIDTVLSRAPGGDS